MEKNETVTDEEKNKEIELKKLLQASLSKKGNRPIELGDVSKWEKISPTTLIVAKTLNLDLKKEYLPLLQKGDQGIYTLILGKYYQKMAEEQGLKETAYTIEGLLQTEGTTMEQLTIYAANTFKEIPDNKELTKIIESAKKKVSEIKKAAKLEDKLRNPEDVSKNEVLIEMAKVALAKASYPILGSLPYSIQEKLEQKIGKEYYSIQEAIPTSMITNAAVTGPVLGGIIGGNSGHTGLGIFLGLLGGALDSGIRLLTSCEDVGGPDAVKLKVIKPFHVGIGMLPLEGLALPFKGIYYSWKKFYAYAEERIKKKRGRQ